MKRKAEHNDEPSKRSRKGEDVKQFSAAATFEKLGLEPRLLQSIQQKRFATPTPIQAQAIPLALAGKDILARSRTGSGKTAAYVLPVLHSILKRKADSTSSKSLAALVLVPTNELASQATKDIGSFASFCAKDIRCENLARKEDEKIQTARLAAKPDIVVATPFKAASYMSSGTLDVSDLAHLVIDEADLVLTYCNPQDLETIRTSVPDTAQSFLMSATLGPETEQLKTMFCKDLIVLKLDEEETDSSGVKQYIIKCGEQDKFLLIYTLFMLKLLKGKTLIFVSDIDRSYRLKLFLEQFGIRSCILNSELPVNSRIHVVEQFNKGIYDIIIASDEQDVLENTRKSRKSRGNEEHVEEDEEEEGEKDQEKEDTNAAEDDSAGDANGNAANGDTVRDSGTSKKKRKKDHRDKDYGVARGIDFQNVATVLNFDLPLTSKSYTHRIGRTARAGKTGMALSFVIPKSEHRKHKPTSIPSTEHDETVLAKIKIRQEKKGLQVEPYAFDMKKLEGFRYRLADALRAVTTGAIREARLRELRQELIKSEKLKRHFEENPDDLRHLRHDGELRAARVQSHLKHVPEYLLPGGGKKALEEDVGFVPLRKQTENRIRRAREQRKSTGRGTVRGAKAAKVRKGKVNPLKSFKGKKASPW